MLLGLPGEDSEEGRLEIPLPFRRVGMAALRSRDQVRLARAWVNCWVRPGGDP